VANWIRLDTDMHADIKLRKARARIIWPWILCRLKTGDGTIADDELDPAIAAEDLDHSVSEARASEMFAALKDVGLLVPSAGGWTSPRWSDQPADSTNAERQRRFRERVKARLDGASGEP
jgi:hypothetical protein